MKARYLMLACLVTTAVHAQVADVSRGRALYENHCQVCHTSKVHARPNRIVLTRSDITAVVERWQAQQKLSWGKQEVEDVVEYLSRTQYRLP